MLVVSGDVAHGPYWSIWVIEVINHRCFECEENVAVSSGAGNDKVTMVRPDKTEPACSMAGPAQTLTISGDSSASRRASSASTGTKQPEQPSNRPRRRPRPTTIGDVGFGAATRINVAANDVAAQGALDLASIAITTGPSAGSVTVNGDGTVTYTAQARRVGEIPSNTPSATPAGRSPIQPPSPSRIRPTATVTSAAPDPTNTFPIPFTVTFNEDVTGFSALGLTVTTASPRPSSRRTPGRTGSSSHRPPGGRHRHREGGAAEDAAGTGNLASNTLSRVSDSVPPTVTVDPLTTDNPTPTLTGTVNDPAATVSVTVNGQTLATSVTGAPGRRPSPTHWPTAAIRFRRRPPDGPATSHARPRAPSSWTPVSH